MVGEKKGQGKKGKGPMRIDVSYAKNGWLGSYVEEFAT